MTYIIRPLHLSFVYYCVSNNWGFSPAFMSTITVLKSIWSRDNGVGLYPHRPMSRRLANQLGKVYIDLSYLSTMMTTLLLIKTSLNGPL